MELLFYFSEAERWVHLDICLVEAKEQARLYLQVFEELFSQPLLVQQVSEGLSCPALEVWLLIVVYWQDHIQGSLQKSEQTGFHGTAY